MKLSQLNYLNILFKYKKETLEKIVFTANKNSNKYDIAIIFGGPDMIPNRINEAINLYKENKLNKILVTGGIGYFNKNRKVPEANIMYNYLLKENIPKKDILIENKSKNTIENILYSTSILNNIFQLKKINILLISSDYHINRCRLLFLKNYKHQNNIFWKNTTSKIINKNNWFKGIKGIFTIKKEALLLSYYAKKNLLIDLDINI